LDVGAKQEALHQKTINGIADSVFMVALFCHTGESGTVLTTRKSKRRKDVLGQTKLLEFIQNFPPKGYGVCTNLRRRREAIQRK